MPAGFKYQLEPPAKLPGGMPGTGAGYRTVKPPSKLEQLATAAGTADAVGRVKELANAAKTRMAGIKPVQFVQNNPLKAAGAGGLLAILAAAAELADAKDPLQKNLIEAGGNLTGGLGLGALGAAGGGLILGPPGALIGGALGSMAGSRFGSGLGSSIYNQLFNSEEAQYAKDQLRQRDAMQMRLDEAQLRAALRDQILDNALERQKDYELNRLANQQALNRQAMQAATIDAFSSPY